MLFLLKAALFVAMAGPVWAQGGPGLDCTKALNDTEVLVCADPQLLALDTELSRLYALAAHGPNVTPDRLAGLKATQSDWTKRRDGSWNTENPVVYIRDSYALRIAELRQQYLDAWQQDEQGVSTGPIALDCDGLGFDIAATFINVEPELVTLHWLDQFMTLGRERTASGAKYSGDDGYMLWTQGDAATLDLPDQSGIACVLDDIG